jgi:hypothetical protein
MTASPKILYCLPLAEPNFVDVTDTRSVFVEADPRVCEEGRAMAYLEITLKVDAADRPQAAGVYEKFEQPFLDSVAAPRPRTCSFARRTSRCCTGFGPWSRRRPT